MDLSLYTADVFTGQPFGGAQIAVFPPRMAWTRRRCSVSRPS